MPHRNCHGDIGGGGGSRDTSAVTSMEQIKNIIKRNLNATIVVTRMTLR
jgi:hypothetical protein